MPGARTAARGRVGLPLRVTLVIGALALSIGLGLVAFFVTGLSLSAGIALAAVVTGAASYAVWRKLDPAQRATVRL
ncbi:MAG: hypothetical protein WCG47_32170, partial [Dermatophilaceae bacterium]